MGPDLHLANDALAVSVSRQGGMLTAAKAGGHSFLCSPQGPTEVACFPMVPLCNRLANNRFTFAGRDYRFTPNTNDPLYLHGDGWQGEWKVSNYSKSQATLNFTHARGPFSYKAQQTIRLVGTTLHLGLSVRNTGTEAMPFGIGFHPYFPRKGAKLQFAATSYWSERQDHLPNTASPIPADVNFAMSRPLPTCWLNNAYEGWRGLVRIDWPHQGMHLDLHADPLFNTLMLYAPDAGNSFFCIEPMSHLPNELNMPNQPNLHVLAPDHSLAGGIRMTITKTEPQ
ncbi:aldose 1-epimerase [Loktanella salsilacus]|uniref:aldose 1-epimerase n=1 Tax=Loktanella salsilacus TaxID=195913 RepID=UPI0037366DAF